MALTNEEIKNGHVSIFDHADVDVHKLEVHGLMRLLQFIPLVEQQCIDLLINKLEEKDIFKQLIKAKCTGAQRYIDSVAKEIYRQYGYRKKWEKDDNADPLAESHMMFSVDMVDKFTQSMYDFVMKIEGITNAQGCLNETEHKQFIIDNATMLCKLQPGDTFVFIDVQHAVEYTYVKLVERKEDYFCKIRKESEDKEFLENDIFRPVVKMTLIPDQTYLKSHFNRLKNYYKHEVEQDEETEICDKM
jgi:hypothetical protein